MNYLVKYNVLRVIPRYHTTTNVKYKKPVGYWNNKENVEEFVQFLSEKLNLKTELDWNLLTTNQVRNCGGSTLLKNYSLHEIKSLGYPKGKLIFSKPIKSKGYWENKENVKLFLNELKSKLNLNTPKKWNLITQKQIHLFGGGSLLKLYSMYDLKCLGCPEGNLEFNKKRNRKKIGYWDINENVYDFISEFKQKLNLNSFNDWNSISQKQIKNYGGSSLLNKFSLFEIKCLGFPEGKHLFHSSSQSKGYWNNIDNIHLFIDKLKRKFNLNTADDWNSLTVNQVKSNGGSQLLNKFSMFELKCIAYPDGIFLYSKNKLHKKCNHDELIEYIKEKLNINSAEDWNRISKTQILSLGGRKLLDNCSTLIPHLNNIQNNIISKSSQRWLFLQIQKIFPGEEIIEDYFHSEISRNTGFPVQFDIFIVKRKIAIEYHGVQHYEDIPAVFAPSEVYRNRDTEKIKLCKTFGIELIIIPYWWDNKFDSLQYKINQTLSKLNE